MFPYLSTLFRTITGTLATDQADHDHIQPMPYSGGSPDIVITINNDDDLSDIAIA